MMRLNLLLLVMLAGAVGANFAVRHEPARPNREYLPEMVHSAAFESVSTNPNFADGKTIQPPPLGTVPHQSGFAEPAPAQDRGALVYQTFCLPCHSASVKGDGPVALRGYPAPASLLAPKAIALTDSKIFDVLTQGQKNMPSYAAQISPDDRRRVITYVRAMQKTVPSGSVKP